TKYISWAGDMEAWFCSQGLWRLVSGSSPCPGEYKAALDIWETRADKAAGWLWLMLESDQKIHVSGIKDDPCTMWK
ncbi:hypothetical protein FA15DRAFT_549638, partial [Coprinopsis marcescibilis]